MTSPVPGDKVEMSPLQKQGNWEQEKLRDLPKSKPHQCPAPAPQINYSFPCDNMGVLLREVVTFTC